MRHAWPAAAILLACLAAHALAQDTSTPAAPPPGPPPATTPPTDATPNATPDKAPPAPAANLETLVAADARSILGKKVSGAAGSQGGDA